MHNLSLVIWALCEISGLICLMMLLMMLRMMIFILPFFLYINSGASWFSHNNNSVWWIDDPFVWLVWLLIEFPAVFSSIKVQQCWYCSYPASSKSKFYIHSVSQRKHCLHDSDLYQGICASLLRMSWLMAPLLLIIYPNGCVMVRTTEFF